MVANYDEGFFFCFKVFTRFRVKNTLIFGEGLFFIFVWFWGKITLIFGVDLFLFFFGLHSISATERHNFHQRWSRGHKARGQGHKKKSEAKAKDSLSEDRHSRGQGHKCKCSPKKKGLHKNFASDLKKKVFTKIFQPLHKLLTIQKILLYSSRGQANFRGLGASRPRTSPSRPRPRTSKCVLEAKDVLEHSTSDFH